MRTFIHIGQHKTGTTSIQHFLRIHKNEFIRRGLYIPDSIAGFDNPSHFVLNVYSLNAHRQSSMKEKLLKNNCRKENYMSELSSSLKKDIAKHYQQASEAGCKDIIWTNEGLYLLNSIAEYTRLYNLFAPYSTEIICVICFRDLVSFKKSYKKQLEKQGIPTSTNQDSYKYTNDDSWLYKYDEKKNLLRHIFDKNIYYLTYDRNHMIYNFFEVLGYPVPNDLNLRLNVSY